MKTSRLQLRIEDDLLKDLEDIANSNSISVSGQVRMLIKKAKKDAEKEYSGRGNR